MDHVSVYLLALLHIAPASLSVYHALLYKRDSRSAMGWIMACIFVPYGGPVAYYLFGINRVRSRARGLRRQLFRIEYEAFRPRVRSVPDAARGLFAVGQRVTGRGLSAGNSIDLLHNGEQAYPAMLASIESATERVLLATYILRTDGIGNEFATALSAAAVRGVSVQVLIDGVGEMYSWPRPSRRLRKLGVPVERFLPPKLFPPGIYLNLRNHRKLLIVDSDTCYAGGMNIGDENLARSGQTRKVSDLHFCLRGPIVSELATLFHSDWHFTTGQPSAEDVARAPAEQGTAKCRLIPDGPDDDLDSLALTLQGVLTAASDDIAIMTPYFLPNRELIAVLQAAALQGVRVRIVLPGKNNLFYVHWANRNLLAELVGWGIEIYYQPAPFCHSKLLCVDNDYCLVGSANLDPRSLRLNFELGIEICSGELNSALRAHFDEVIAKSEKVTVDTLRDRSIPIRLRDSFAALFTPYL